MRARWIGSILAVFFMFAIWPVVAERLAPIVTPIERYYSLGTIFVHDSEVGALVRMTVDREIHRDFEGFYENRLFRADGPEFAPWTRANRSDVFTYYDDAVLPNPLTLDWWYGRAAADLRLPAGQYKLRTTVCALGFMHTPICVRRDSNVFTIEEAAE